MKESNQYCSDCLIQVLLKISVIRVLSIFFWAYIYKLFAINSWMPEIIFNCFLLYINFHFGEIIMWRIVPTIKLLHTKWILPIPHIFYLLCWFVPVSISICRVHKKSDAISELVDMLTNRGTCLKWLELCFYIDASEILIS